MIGENTLTICMPKPRRPSLNARRLYGLIRLKTDLENEMRDMWQMGPDEQKAYIAKLAGLSADDPIPYFYFINGKLTFSYGETK